MLSQDNHMSATSQDKCDSAALILNILVLIHLLQVSQIHRIATVLYITGVFKFLGWAGSNFSYMRNHLLNILTLESIKSSAMICNSIKKYFALWIIGTLLYSGSHPALFYIGL